MSSRDPQLVGIVVRFYFDDYAAFRLPLPPFAARALEQLQARRDPHALPPEQLQALKMHESGTAVSRPGS